MKRPRVGDKVETRVGTALVAAVHGRSGQAITVTDRIDRTFRFERADHGHWTVHHSDDRCTCPVDL